MAIGNGFVAITLSDTVNIRKNTAGNYPIALRFGTGGTASLVGADGSTAVFTNIANGETIPVSAVRINSTGSSGIADVIGIYG